MSEVERCFKVVRRYRGRYVSALVPPDNRLCLQYGIGAWVRPLVGGVVAFTDWRCAVDWVEGCSLFGFPVDDKHLRFMMSVEVWEAEGKGRLTLPAHPSFSFDPDEMEKVWRLGEFSIQSSWPAGTVAFAELRIIRPNRYWHVP